jgi:succinate dehydrogenase flavin-adding protein (antitoxin of CptAB toxin-antitoxin module)
MNDPDLPAIYSNFATCRAALNTLVLQDEFQSQELAAAQQNLAIAFDQLLAAFSPRANHRMRTGLTEIHRLLKLADRDLQFWQGARQPTTRKERQQNLLLKLQQIADWQQVFEVDVDPSSA